MAVDALNKESYFAESEKKGTYPTYRLEQIDYADSIYYNATTDQLVALATSSPSHITRLWALRFLSEEPNKQVLGILRRAINDTTSVWLMSRMGVHEVEPYNRLAFRYYNGASTKMARRDADTYRQFVVLRLHEEIWVWERPPWLPSSAQALPPHHY